MTTTELLTIDGVRWFKSLLDRILAIDSNTRAADYRV
jgi:hypothetical protein